MTKTVSETIDYGRRTPRRRRLWRRVVVVIILMAVIIVARWTAPPLLRQFEVRREQAKLLGFTAPADTIAFTTDPADCDRLLRAGTHVLVKVHYVGSGGGYGRWVAGFTPTLADPLFNSDVWGISKVSRGMTLDRGDLKGMPIGPPPTLFLHARRAPGKPARLVHVAAVLYYDDMPLADARNHIGGEWEKFEKQERAAGNADVSAIRLSLTPRVFSTASWLPGSAWMRLQSATQPPANNGEIPLPGRAYATAIDVMQVEALPLRIRAGVADLANEARFTLAYDVNGVAGVIEGRLGTNDVVIWTILSGPLKQWPPRDGFWGLNP